MDRGYDNVLPGWGYRTPHGAVIDVYRGMVEFWLAGKKLEKFGENPTPLPHEPHIKLHGIASRPPR
jgi:hypothetical protein